MARPLLRHTIVELDQLFSRANGDSETLQALADELKHRNVPRAVVLLNKIQQALRGGNASWGGPAPSPSSQQALMTESLRRDAKMSAPKNIAQPNRSTSWQAAGGPGVVPHVPLAPVSTSTEGSTPMSVAEAYEALEMTPGATWEVIEYARRQIVQKAHPHNVAGLSPEHRTRMQSEARHANAAYAVLLKAQIPNVDGYVTCSGRSTIRGFSHGTGVCPQPKCRIRGHQTAP